MPRGSTFIELMVVIALIGLITALGLPFAHNFAIRQEVPTASRDLLHALRRAQIRAVLDEDGETLGVHLIAGTSTTFTVFRGSSYAARDASVDEDYVTSPSVGISFDFPGSDVATDIVFSRLRGQPNATGTIFLYTPGGGSQQIAIGAQGLIQAQ